MGRGIAFFTFSSVLLLSLLILNFSTKINGEKEHFGYILMHPVVGTSRICLQLESKQGSFFDSSTEPCAMEL
jgi:hypothetical protein